MSQKATYLRSASVAALAFSACCLSFAALSPARAAEFDWTYTGGITGMMENGSGTLTTGGPGGGIGGFDTTSITGTFNGSAVTGVLPPNTCCGLFVSSIRNSNFVYPDESGSIGGNFGTGIPGQGGFVNLNGLGFSIAGGATDSWVQLAFNGTDGLIGGVRTYATFLGGPGNTGGTFQSTGSFTLNEVPLPPAIYLFGSVLGGAFWMRRRKHSVVSSLGAA